mgnify:FL=1
MKLSRRSILHSVAAIAGFGVVDPANAKININSSIDLTNPMDNVTAFSKLAGSLKQETVHYFYDGTIYGMASEESYPLFNYSGIMKFVWQPI